LEGERCRAFGRICPADEQKLRFTAGTGSQDSFILKDTTLRYLMGAGCIIGIITALKFTINDDPCKSHSVEVNRIARYHKIIHNVQVYNERDRNIGNDFVLILVAGKQKQKGHPSGN